MRAGQPMTLSTTQIPIVPAKDELSSAVVEQVQHWVLDASQQKNSLCGWRDPAREPQGGSKESLPPSENHTKIFTVDPSCHGVSRSKSG